MDGKFYVIGMHKQMSNPPIKPEKAICVLCDEVMWVSGYGTDPETLKTYKLNGAKNKHIAMECATQLMGQLAHALQAFKNVEELLKEKKQ